MLKRLKETAKTSRNRAGSVFSYDEFRRLLMTPYKESEIDLIEWIVLRFCAVTLLLGCLRSEQFNKFREGGTKAIEWLRDNRDNEGKLRPVVHSASAVTLSCSSNFRQPSKNFNSRHDVPCKEISSSPNNFSCQEVLDATSIYNRVKNRNGPNPCNEEQDFHLTMVCLCPDGHQPIS